jgi:hypothetical protein
MLQANVTDEHPPAGAVRDGGSEHLLAEKDPERVVQHHPVPDIEQARLCGVEPAVHVNVILRIAAPLAGGPFGMNERVAHSSTS